MTTRTAAPHFIALLCMALPLCAQTAAPVEQRLREQLKSLAAQLKTAETEKAALQTEKTTLQVERDDLASKIKKLGEQSAADQDAAKKKDEKFTAEIKDRQAEIDRMKGELAKAVKFGTDVSELAKKNGDEKTRLAAEVLQLKRTVADQRAKNGKMFEIGNEILDRYAKFGLGTALTAREPFVGITRARLETMVDDYGGRLAEQRLKAVPNTPPAGKPAAESRKSSKTAAAAKVSKPAAAVPNETKPDAAPPKDPKPDPAPANETKPDAAPATDVKPEAAQPNRPKD